MFLGSLNFAAILDGKGDIRPEYLALCDGMLAPDRHNEERAAVKDLPG